MPTIELGFVRKLLRQLPDGRPHGSYPETAFGEITSDYGEVILIATDGIVLALRLLLRQNSPQSSDKLLDKLDKFYEL